MSFSGHEEDLLFMGNGAGHFEDRAFQARLDLDGDGRSAVWADLDGDGDLDLIVREQQKPKLLVLRNELAPGAHWLEVDLQGTRSNRMGIGAIARVHAGGKTLTRLVRAGHGYLAQGPARLHFGLGGAAKIEALEIEWPTGEVQRFTDVPLDAIVRAREGESKLTSLAKSSVPLGPTSPPQLSLASLAQAATSGEASAALLAAQAAHKPVLVNLWAPWCKPCREEAPLLAAHVRACGDRAASVALSMEPDLAKSTASARELGLALPVATANEAQAALLEHTLQQLPLPSTLVFDANGKLTGAIVGKASAEGLERLLPCSAQR